MNVKRMDSNKPSIGLFIDADNAPAKQLKSILSTLNNIGRPTIKRAYGNWERDNLKSWKECLHDHAIVPIQQFDLIKGKNATDMAITIDAMDVLYTKQIDIFCIVSSDCDFAPLAVRLISEGKQVIGFGKSHTPTPFTNACSEFIVIDEPAALTDDESQTPKHTNKTNQKTKGEAELLRLIQQAIKASQDDQGWATLSAVGSNINHHITFNPKNYGFKNLSDLLRDFDLFELVYTKNQTLMVRDKSLMIFTSE